MNKPRRSARVEVELSVDLICDGVTRRCTTRNIGLGGVFVNAEAQSEAQWVPAPGTPVEICFLGVHTIAATVLRADTSGIALLFSQVDQRDFAFLSALLHSRAA